MSFKLNKGSSSQTTKTHSESTSTYTPEQMAQYASLLKGADQWMNNGGLAGTAGQQEDNIANAINATGNYYAGVLTGNADRTALDAAKQANADAAQTTFERSTMPAITDQAQQAGQVGSSRQGIAAGLAASDMDSQVGQQNAQMEYQWQQQQQQNKQAAAGGMLSVANALGQLQDSQAASSDSAMALQSLLAYRDLVSGNMGGTTNVVADETSTTSGGGSGGGIAGVIAAGIGAAGDILSSTSST